MLFDVLCSIGERSAPAQNDGCPLDGANVERHRRSVYTGKPACLAGVDVQDFGVKMGGLSSTKP